MCNRLKTVLLLVVWTVCWTAGAAMSEEDLTFRDVGTALRHNTIYRVRENLTLDASAMPGVSALRVPVGVSAIINISNGATLTVKGGAGYGEIGGGAGIEVPAGAKLVICGKGTLNAFGGAAAAGGKGYGGLAGMFSYYFDPHSAPDGELPCPREDLPPIDVQHGVCSTNFCSTPLYYGRAGVGGDGGAGGGGAGAGIGGRGGQGGQSGEGGISRPVVPPEHYAARMKDYLDCERYFDMSNTAPFYVYNLYTGYRLDGVQGGAGGAGTQGGSCGEVIFAGSVTVNATPASAAAGGEGGPCGTTYQFYNDSVPNVGAIRAGFSAGSKFCTTVGMLAKVIKGLKMIKNVSMILRVVCTVEGILDTVGVLDRAKLKYLHSYTGGGGGGGGAGGSEAPFGVGIGGAGGGGGGGGGSGLFIIGAGNIYTTSFLGKPDLTEPPLTLSGHGGAGGKGESSVLSGKSGSEVEHVDSKSVPYNYRDGRICAWSWLQSSENWAWSGLGAAGGAAGGTNTSSFTLWRSATANVTGLPTDRTVNVFDGSIANVITFKDGDDAVAADYVSGTILECAPLVHEETQGHYFAGYYTAENGSGAQLFDRFAQPVNGASVSSNMILYAHWTTQDPDCRITKVVEVGDGVGATNGQVLASETIYHFTKNLAYLSEKGAALTLSSGRTIFYIPKGVKIELTGGSATNDTSACPGLAVPTNATLIVVGGGELIATGGNAANGGNGAAGEDGTKEDVRYDPWMETGAGGAGGIGGGGAAPGIGGLGGAGSTAGGAGGAKEHRECKVVVSGNAGSAGGAGQDGGGMGSVYLLGGSVTATAGTKGEQGTAGVGGGYAYHTFDVGYGFHWHYSGGGGGGGAGGGGGEPRYGIGGGGGGGGAGGGGGSGRFTGVQTENRTQEFSRGHTGTGGSRGQLDGAAGAVDTTNQGGEAGGGGAAGALGGDGELYVVQSATLAISGDRLPKRAWGHPALQRDITFSCEGKEVGKVAAQLGMPLPILSTNRLACARGYVIAGAYQVISGATNWWYGVGGQPFHDYEGLEDVTLELVFMPDYGAMASLPGPIHYDYNGSNDIAFVAAEYPSCAYVDGVTNATDAGVYNYRVKLTGGRTIWDDLETNDIREIQWTIAKASITNDWKNNILLYDWTKSPEVNEQALYADVSKTLGFKLPEGATVTFKRTRRVGEALFSLEARIDGGKNYLDRTLYGAYEYPQILNMLIVSYYPWSTDVEVEYTSRKITQDPDLDAFCNVYGNYTINASVLLSETNEEGECFADVELCKVKEFMKSGNVRGYKIFDMKDLWAQLPNVRTNKLAVYLSIADIRFAYGEIPIDLTGEKMSESDALLYTLDTTDNLFPFLCSWRLVDAGKIRESSGCTLYFSAVEESEPANWFVPFTSMSPITDYSVVWRPTNPADKTYRLEHRVCGVTGVTNGYRSAYFKFTDATPSPEPTNIVAIVTRKSTGRSYSYATLADAVADLFYGDMITVVGDVQMESVKVPSGTYVQVGDDGVLRNTFGSDLQRPYHKATIETNVFGKVLSATYALDEEQVRPAIASDGEHPAFEIVYDETIGKMCVRVCVTNLKDDLYYTLHNSHDLVAWADVDKSRIGKTGSECFTTPLESSTNGFYRVSVTDDPSPLFKTTENGDGTLSIVSVSDSASSALSLPGAIGAKTVTRIANYAFQQNQNICRVEMSDAIRDVGQGAFYNCRSLMSIALSEGVTNIGDSAFGNCASLAQLELPETLVAFGQHALDGTVLTSLVIPASVVQMPVQSWPDTLKYVRFLGDKTDGIALPLLGVGKIVYVEPGATGWGTVPRTLEDGSRIEYWEDLIFARQEDGFAVMGAGPIADGNLEIPSEWEGLPVIAIADCAFTNHTDITNVVIPASVARIGARAFNGCTNLTTMTIGAGVETIGAYAFGSESAVSTLATIWFDGDAPQVEGDLGLNSTCCVIYVPADVAGWGATPGIWQGCLVLSPGGALSYQLDADGNLIVVSCATDAQCVEVPSGSGSMTVKAVKATAFAGCTNLQMIVFSGPPLDVSDGTYCHLPTNCVIALRTSATGWDGAWMNRKTETLQDFATSTNESEVTITGVNGAVTGARLWVPPFVDGMRVKGIAAQAFASLTAVEQVVVSKGVDYIGEGALPNSVKECIFDGDAPQTVETQTLDATKCTIFVRPESHGWDAMWQGCPVVRYHVFTCKFNDNALTITGVATNSLTGALYIPETIDGYVVSKIGNGAFMSKSITSLVLPSTVRIIENTAFADCASMTNIEIRSSDSLCIYAGAFIRNRKLENITFTSALGSGGSIYGYAFQSCDALSEVRLPEGVTYLGEYVFQDCSLLKTIYLPSTLENIQEAALWSSLSTCVFAGNPPRYDQYKQGIDIGTCKIYAPASATGWDTTWHGCEVIRY